MAMNQPGHAILLGLLLLSSAVWLGGWVSLLVIARSMSATLSREARVAFFRHFGRRYGVVATVALALALIAGIPLLASAPWTAISTCLLIAAAVLVVVLGLGVLQARRMTQLRSASIAASGDIALASRLARGARAAVLLRATIGVISLVILALAVVRAA